MEADPTIQEDLEDLEEVLRQKCLTVLFIDALQVLVLQTSQGDQEVLAEARVLPVEAAAENVAKTAILHANVPKVAAAVATNVAKKDILPENAPMAAEVRR